MKIVTHGARVLLGLALLIFGSNYFTHLIPMPMPEMSGLPGEFMDALYKSGLLGVVKFLEVVAGILLLTGIQVPLALLIAFPINVVTIFFHTVLAGFNPVVFIMMAFTLYLAYVYKNNFANIFNTNNAWTALE